MRNLRQRTDRARTSGFTLIELLVAVGLLSILLYMLAFSFAQAYKAFALSTQRIDANQEARAILDMMARELQAAELTTYFDAGYTRRTGVFTAAETTTDVNGPADSLKRHAQRVTFTTRDFQAGGNNPAGANATVPQLVEVRYRHEFPFLETLNSDADQRDIEAGRPDEKILYKSIHWTNWATWNGDTTSASADDRFKPSSPNIGTGAEGAGFSVIFFGLRFYDAGIATPAWTTDGNWTKSYLPAAVEITLVVRPANSQREFPFVRVVDIPAARP